MTASAETLSEREHPPTRYEASLVLSSSTAPAPPLTASRPDAIETGLSPTPAIWSVSSYFGRRTFASRRYTAPAGRSFWTMGTYLARETAERSGATGLNPSTIGASDADLDDMLAMAQQEDFEPGLHSRFAGQLKTFIDRWGEGGIAALHDRIHRGLRTDITTEGLSVLGRMRQGMTRDARLATLAAFLRHREAAVRDAAMRGLVDIDDSRVRPLFLQALAVEPNELLRRSLEEMLALVP